MNISLTCIIVDDEPPAIRLLKKYVEKVPFLELIGTYTNPLEALQHIEKEKIESKKTNTSTITNKKGGNLINIDVNTKISIHANININISSWLRQIPPPCLG